MIWPIVLLTGFSLGLTTTCILKIAEITDHDPFTGLIDYYQNKEEIVHLKAEQTNAIASLRYQKSERNRLNKKLSEKIEAYEFGIKQYNQLVQNWLEVSSVETVQASEVARTKLYSWAKSKAKTDNYLKNMSGLLSASQDNLSPLFVLQMQGELSEAFQGNAMHDYVMQAYGTRVNAHASPVQAALELYMLYGSFNAFAENRAKSQD